MTELKNDRTTKQRDNLSWLIHSKSLMLETSSSTSFAATSLAWTSMTISADSTARCMLDRRPLTSCTKSLNFRNKGGSQYTVVCTMYSANVSNIGQSNTKSPPVSVVGDKGVWPSLPAPRPQTPQQSRRPDSQLSPLDQATIAPTLYEVAEGSREHTHR